MPPIKLQRVVTCSSQDSAFPAENLLKSGTSHKWKCKAGEQSATVVIQLEKSSVISGIDIGNECSAFIEVLVGRESVPDDFKVILVMSSFMTPMDARNETTTNRVRIFREEHLSQPVCTEKWDRIKIVCTQPFNKHLQYGLSFITLHESKKADESAVPNMLGRFTLKNDEDDISVGSIFARRKEEPQPDPQPPKAAYSWRDAVKESSSKRDSESKKAAKKEKNTTPKPKTSDESNNKTPTNKASRDKPQTNSDKGAPQGNTKTPSTKDLGKKKEKRALSPPPQTPAAKRQYLDEGSSSGGSKEVTNPNVIYKPFNKLLENVEFAISGYVNPGRADIRSKALEMGAKYRPDWTSTCSHLICAFANTPKFQAVQGKGKIVFRDWIDDCHRERKQLPWRRYAVDKADQVGGNHSDEKEVWELVEDKKKSTAAERRNTLSSQSTSVGSREEDSGPDTEDEIEMVVQQKKKMEAVKNRELNNGATSRQNEKNVQKEGSPDTEQKDAVFDVSTDEESDKESKGVTWPELPSMFKNKFFHVHESLPKHQREELERYIIAFCGTLCKDLDENVHFVVTERKKDVTEEDATGAIYVRPDWIWECNDAGRVVPVRDHEL